MRRLVREAGVGTTLVYTVERGDQRFQVAVPTMAFTSDILWRFIPGYIFVGFLCVAVGVFVYVRSPGQLTRYLLLYLSSYAGFLMVWEYYLSQQKWMTYFIQPCIEFTADGGERLPAPVETALFRVVQEALNNVVRHAQAHRVEVAMTRDRGEVTLRIADDGQGFDPQAPQAGTHVGLWSMRERVEHLGGRFVVESAPGAGTTVRAIIPLGTNGYSNPRQLVTLAQM